MRRQAVLLLTTAATAALVAVLMASGLASAQTETTFTVDRSDDPDLTTTPTADDCTTATANDCSLRGAITAANSNNNPTEKDTIDFAIPEDPTDPDDDVKTILVDGDGTVGGTSRDLPNITEAVTINGYTQPGQPGASPNTNTDLAQGTDANLLIVLDGAFRTVSGNGLTISASDVVVKGLVITRFSTGIFIQSGGSRAVIQGNFIGTDRSGTQQNPANASDGVVVFGRDNIIGGQEPAARNLISGNPVRGLFIGGDGGNTIQGNLIGTKAKGTNPNEPEPLRNFRQGVLIISPNNTVGGIDSDPTDTNNPANLIAFNGTDGVLVFGGLNNAFSVGNRILSNSIFSNVEEGIDLDGSTSPSGNGDGVTPNDSGDGDTGPNKLQNFPVLSSAGISSSTTTTSITGTLNSAPGTTYNVQFFSSPSADASGNGEGKTHLGQKDVTTNASGNASFTFGTSDVSVGEAVTATATSPGGDTSEFSNAVTAATDTTPPTVTSVTPPANRSGNITVQFSEAMNPDTLMQNPNAQPSTSTTILLFKGGPTSTTQVPAKVSCADELCQTVTLDPDATLGKRKTYTVRIEGAGDADGLAVKDLVGNELAQEFTSSFKTRRR